MRKILIEVFVLLIIFVITVDLTGLFGDLWPAKIIAVAIAGAIYVLLMKIYESRRNSEKQPH